MRILVSACLLGVPCRYDGQAKPNQEVLALAEHHQLIPFCPEVYGGLPTPREPAEIRDGRVQTVSGRDVTAAYDRGAEEAVKLAQRLHCDCAVLQDRSPSCGLELIHDGSFSGALTAGDGRTAARLKEAGLRVWKASQAGKNADPTEEREKGERHGLCEG